MQTTPGTAGDDGSHPDSRNSGSRLRARQIEVLYDQLPVALAASLAAALILISILWTVTPGTVLATWLVLLILITTLRSVMVHRYRRSGNREKQSGYWMAWFIAGTLASGIVWDATIILLAPHGSDLHVGIAVLWVCGLTAGSVAALSPVKGAFFSFAIPALVPGAIYLLFTGDRIEVMISGAVFLFLGFLSLNALRMHGTIRQSLQLQFENSALITHLDAEKDRIERLNEQLEKRVAERTAEISAADAAKSRFLAAASHDLRQQLHTFSLLTEVLSRTVREPGHTRAVHELRDTINVMSSLLDALLDVSKLDSGAITPEVTDFSIGELLERLRIDFVNHARIKGLSLHVVPSFAVIRSDPALLEQILRNMYPRLMYDLTYNRGRSWTNVRLLLECAVPVDQELFARG